MKAGLPGAVVSAKPPRLRVYWSKRERDIMYHHDGQGSPPFDDIAARGADARLLYWAFGTGLLEGKSLLQELELRGYDLTTLRFSIRRKAVGGHKL